MAPPLEEKASAGMRGQNARFMLLDDAKGWRATQFLELQEDVGPVRKSA